MFTRFSDMCSGGYVKITGYEWVIIEAPEDEAIDYFIERFERDPYNVTCKCCGRDYSIEQNATLEESFHKWMDMDKTLVIMKNEM